LFVKIIVQLLHCVASLRRDKETTHVSCTPVSKLF